MKPLSFFSRLLSSPVWECSANARTVWIGLWGLCEHGGHLRMDDGPLRRLMNLPNGSLDRGLNELEKASLISRGEERQGERHITLLGYFDWLNVLTQDAARNYFRDQQRHYRRKHRTDKPA